MVEIRYTNDARYNPDDLDLVYATAGAAAVDLRLAECARVPRGQIVQARTGLRVEIPKGMAGLILPRSGLGTKGLVLANTVGLIDSDYRGEIYLALLNRNTGGPPIHIEEGARAAQMLFIVVPEVNLVRVNHLSETARGSGGFGSTGVK